MRFPYSASYVAVFSSVSVRYHEQKKRFWFDYLQTELEAHIWCVSRSHQYYSHTKYELLTPSRNGRTRISIIESEKPQNLIIQALLNTPYLWPKSVTHGVLRTDFTELEVSIDLGFFVVQRYVYVA